MNNYRTYKMKLSPTPEQFIVMFTWGEYSRDFYDHTLSYLKRCYYEAQKATNFISTDIIDIMSEDELMKKFRNEQATRSVYSCCPHSICDGAIHKAYHDVWAFDNEWCMFMPKCSYYRTGVGKYKLSFSIYPREIRITETDAQINELGKVRLAERGRIPTGAKLRAPWVTYDGSDWYLSVKAFARDSVGLDNKHVKPYIKSTDIEYKNLISQFDRLENYEETFNRKTALSQNWYKSKERLQRHAKRVAHIILDIEHKYNCSYVKFDIEIMKREVRNKLYAL